jgi:hypothetical protein
MRGFLLIFLLITSLFGSVGKVAALKGEAFVVRGSEEIPLILGMELQEHDQIQTLKKAKVHLMLKDRTLITIGQKSTFAIDKYQFSDQTTKPSANFKMKKGIFRTITGKIGKMAPDKFKIKTQTATIGIRGTRFDVRATPSLTEASVDQGVITFLDDASAKMVEVPQGNRVEVNLNTQAIEVKAGRLEISSELDDGAVSATEEAKVIEVVQADEEVVLEDSVDSLNDTVEDEGDMLNLVEQTETTLAERVTLIQNKAVYGLGSNLPLFYWKSNNGLLEPAISTGWTDRFDEIGTNLPTDVIGQYTGTLGICVDGCQATVADSIEGSFTLNTNFSKQTIFGNMSFEDRSDRIWDVKLNETTINPASANQFVFDDEVTKGSGSDVQNITGTVAGKFYGDSQILEGNNALGVAGTASFEGTFTPEGEETLNLTAEKGVFTGGLSSHLTEEQYNTELSNHK